MIPFPRIQRLWNRFSNDMGIDLGTANTLVYVRGQGIVLREPSVVAVHESGEVLAVGEEAKRMVGRTPASIKAIRPMKDGVIADFDVTEQMIRYFIQKVHNRRALVAPRIVIGIPSGITEVERRAVREAALAAGAAQVWLIEECVAAAIGANLPIEEPKGNMIVTIGGGTTEVAVISLGDIVVAKSLRIAGDEIDEAISAHLRKNCGIQVGESTAEALKISIGSAAAGEWDCEAKEVRGRDFTGLPRTVLLKAPEVREAIAEPVGQIVDAIRNVLEETPPELAGDIMQAGITIGGGGALLRGFSDLLTKTTGLPVHVAEDPLSVVCVGTGKYLEELSGKLRKVA